MKKLLLTTGIFLSFSLIASAQKKAATTTPATPAAAIAKQRNNQKMLLPQDNTAVKDQIVADKEAGVQSGKRPATKVNTTRKSTTRTTKQKQQVAEPAQ